MATLILSLLCTLCSVWLWDVPKTDVRAAILKTWVIMGVFICIMTEALSLAGSLALLSISILWFGVMGISFFVLLGVIQSRRHLFLPVLEQIRETFSFSSLDPLTLIPCIGVGVIWILTLITAVFSPPNNIDSLIYHLPRVMHWIQNQTVNHYPTAELRQLTLPPGPSFALTHIMVLAGNDLYVNWVQWSAFVVSVLSVSLIVKQLGGSVRAQALSALIAASVPMAILQSSTTQTDLSISLWLLILLYFTLRTESYGWLDLLWLSGSFSLIVLTKPTGLILAGPIFLILFIRLIQMQRNDGLAWPQRIPWGMGFSGAVAALGSLPSIPYFVRNYTGFGSIFGTSFGTINERLTPAGILSILLRNLALNIPIEGIWQGIVTLHTQILGFGPDDPQTTFRGAFDPGLAIYTLTPYEDYAGSLAHLIVIGLCSGLALGSLWSNRREPGQDPTLTAPIDRGAAMQLAVIVILGFFLFSALLKWQEWGNRLMLPIGLLACPLVGLCVDQLKISARGLLIAIFLPLGIFYALTSANRPILPLAALVNTEAAHAQSILLTPREELYYTAVQAASPQRTAQIQSIQAQIPNSPCQFLGLQVSGNFPEYLIWTTIRRQDQQIYLRHIDVTNPSSQFAPTFPDAVLCGSIQILN